jgi:hypothetical protein
MEAEKVIAPPLWRRLFLEFSSPKLNLHTRSRRIVPLLDPEIHLVAGHGDFSLTDVKTWCACDYTEREREQKDGKRSKRFIMGLGNRGSTTSM